LRSTRAQPVQLFPLAAGAASPGRDGPVFAAEPLGKGRFAVCANLASKGQMLRKLPPSADPTVTPKVLLLASGVCFLLPGDMLTREHLP
jgi:hypothetical protein